MEPATFQDMSGIGANLKSWIARNRHAALVQYGGAALAVWVALSLWTFSPVLHRHLFALLLAAVLFTARFLGFGPAVFCSLVSTACLDFFLVPPYFSFRIHSRRRPGTAAGFPRHFRIRRKYGPAENTGGIARRPHHSRDGSHRGILLRCHLQHPSRWRHHQLESRRRKSLRLHGRGSNRRARGAAGAAGTPRRGGTKYRDPQSRRPRRLLSDRAHAQGRHPLAGTAVGIRRCAMPAARSWDLPPLRGIFPPRSSPKKPSAAAKSSPPRDAWPLPSRTRSTIRSRPSPTCFTWLAMTPTAPGTI